jgi:hypothetical protein
MNQWYYRIDGEFCGPFNDAELKLAARKGTVEPDTLVQLENTGPWVRANTLDILTSVFDPNGGSVWKTGYSTAVRVLGTISLTASIFSLSVFLLWRLVAVNAVGMIVITIAWFCLPVAVVVGLVAIGIGLGGLGRPERQAIKTGALMGLAGTVIAGICLFALIQFMIYAMGC